MHKPITFKNLSIFFKHKSCIDDFSAQIHFGSRIAIIGRNGSGKTTLLKLLLGEIEASAGSVYVPDDVAIGYVPQVIEDYQTHSGGQRFNKALTSALVTKPNVLLLDEPTNHLDKNNRKSLLRMLNDFYGTLIVVTHDVEVLRNCIDTIWHIDQDSICIFSGNYDDYMYEMQQKKQAIEQKILQLNREKKSMHTQLMKEQHRSAKSKAKGKKSIDNKKWPTVVSKAKATRSEKTSGKKKSAISQKKQELIDELSSMRLFEEILPRFSLSSSANAYGVLLNIANGSIGYKNHSTIVNNIYLSLSTTDRVAISGNNGSGKTTLVKAILDDSDVVKAGEWLLPSSDDIGYLDQHYANVPKDSSVVESLMALVPTWDMTKIRRHLADFLFKDNDSVNMSTCHLSGGEKARLSLAMIAARPPKILILDEVTNNLDIETVMHVTDVIAAYPGALLVISHSESFLQAIHVSRNISLEQGEMLEKPLS